MAVNRLLQRILAFRFRGDPPSDWQPHLAELDFVKTLDGDERRRLVQLARMFESVVRFDSRYDLEITERMIRLTALQACRLVIGLGAGTADRILVHGRSAIWCVTPLCCSTAHARL